MDYIEYIDRKTGNLLRETVPGEQWLKWLYHNPLGKLALHSVVKKKLISEWYGRKMDSPESCAKITGFVKDLGIDMSEAIRPMEDYASFNDFFIRELKAEARPIDNTPGSVVSPADGKVLAFKNMERLDSFFVKGQSFSLDDFLQNRHLSEKYNGGSLLIFRLAPVDYHRFHFPADGQISASTQINGEYYSVSPYAVRNMLRVYWENKREYSTLKTDTAGDILLCEVGATMVGSIIQSYTPDSMIHKGQEKGLFKFGGSTVIMLLEKGKTKIDEDILQNTANGFETSIKMGQPIAASCIEL
ncbi:phosphatidylserine decarboxylase [Desulfovibrio sp. JC010]|uniref:phosphatidylserine decarboxylase n=1 Tax=Desulfovibrio sp. JC010 TaxID=2593641 RepID=UPI0013D5797C|nr:phosphatidylserine decarboxylase [Desulfovibrio sp. JC010]NDV28102.1 phosphatidylserine decarboxylase [Desulfovibrio sp. JC010]